MPILCPACQKPFDGSSVLAVVCCTFCGKNFDPQQKGTVVDIPPNNEHNRKQENINTWQAQEHARCNQYILKKDIGRGGMSEVWSASGPQDRNYVVKILLSQHANNEHIRQRFFREIDSVSRLRHQHIIPVIDHGEIDGRPYLVSDILAKESLRAHIHGGNKRKNISHKQLKKLGKQCLSALDHAHQKGIVHRDIKPENILVLDTGDYALTDFGIAHVTTASDGKTLTMLTDTNMVLGTFSYMAPEQSHGSRDIDART
ncbi:MAG: serine/threonine protein kinase, partial [Planctomycetes bacterium]|nr:serine/threonine protein kinase [Planctomycetota bacterium]